MKTIEEMKEAVLAYCEEACPKGTKEAIIANGVTLEWIDYGDVMTGGLRLYGVADWMYIEADMDEYVTLHAYRLLGLETRDALAPYKSENERLQSAWMTEKARNAALVAALENVSKEPIYFYGTAQTIEKQAIASVTQKCNLAKLTLEEYRKGRVRE